MHVCQDVSLYVKFENDGQLIIIQPLYIKHYTCIIMDLRHKKAKSLNKWPMLKNIVSEFFQSVRRL